MIEGDAPLTVTFEAEANGYTPDFRWEFGDGSEILFSGTSETTTTAKRAASALVSIDGSKDLVSDTVTITVGE